MPQGNSYQDLQDFRDMIVEGEDLFEEALTIVRTTSQPTTPGAMQGAPKPVTVHTPSTAVILELGVASKMFAAGVDFPLVNDAGALMKVAGEFGIQPVTPEFAKK